METVSEATGETIPLPGNLQKFSDRPKVTVPLPASYDRFREYLMDQS